VDTIWAKKNDLEGHPLWNTGRVKIGTFTKLLEYKVIYDSAGGAIILWFGADNKFYLERIDTDGNLVWSQDKGLSDVIVFNLINNNNVSLIITLLENDNSYFIRKINLQGQFTWDKELDLQPSDDSNSGYFAASIIDDYAGGAIINWVKYPGSSSPANPSPASNVFRRIDKEGKIAWTIERKPVEPLRGEKYSILDDGSGGTFLFSSNGQTVFVERIDSEGQPIWPESSRLLLYSDLQEFGGPLGFNIMSDSKGGVILVRLSYSDNHYIPRIQRLDSSGNKLWTEAGVPVAGTPESRISYSLPLLTIPDNSSYIASWKAHYTLGTIFVQKINTDGELLWGQNGISLDAWRKQ
jgi:hypothetical protein